MPACVDDLGFEIPLLVTSSAHVAIEIRCTREVDFGWGKHLKPNAPKFFSDQSSPNFVVERGVEHETDCS